MSSQTAQKSDIETKHSLCPNKEICGSCKWSHIPYEKQLTQKLSDINGSFSLNGLPNFCKSIIPAPKTTHYRNRMDFAINFQGLVGLREKGKWWRVIDGHHCFISDELIEAHFHHVRDWVATAGLSFFDRKKHFGLLRYAVIRASLTGETLLSIITSAPEGDEEERIREQLQKLAETAAPTSLVWGIADTVSDVSRGDRNISIHGEEWIHEVIGGYNYRIGPYDFFQTNSSCAEHLLSTVVEYVKACNPKQCVDLYCGSGFFTIPLRDLTESVIGVEIVPEAIDRAIQNAILNRKEIDFHVAKTEEYPWGDIKPDTIVVDPPRAGLHDKVIEEIKTFRPKNIVYVSCNYKALARELALLGDYYEVVDMKAIDMFPHTPHVEVVARLECIKE